MLQLVGAGKHAKDDTEKLWEKVPVCLRRLKGDDLPAVLQHRVRLRLSLSFSLPLPRLLHGFTIPSFLSLLSSIFHCSPRL